MGIPNHYYEEEKTVNSSMTDLSACYFHCLVDGQLVMMVP